MSNYKLLSKAQVRSIVDRANNKLRELNKKVIITTGVVFTSDKDFYYIFNIYKDNKIIDKKRANDVNSFNTIFKELADKYEVNIIYDYVFYMSLGVKYNAEYLNGKFAESTGMDPKDVTDELIKEKLRERFENADYDLVMADIKPFVLENNTINAITKDMLLATVNIISHE